MTPEEEYDRLHVLTKHLMLAMTGMMGALDLPAALRNLADLGREAESFLSAYDAGVVACDNSVATNDSIATDNHGL